MARTYDRIDEALRARKRVEVLYLMLGRAQKLDVDLRAFPTLRSLTLLGGNLRRLPHGLFECAGLRELHLGVPLARLPAAIGGLERLESLTVSGAGLTRLPPEIGALDRLRYLSLEHNRLRSLPDVFDRLPNLHTLVLFQNRLTSVPPSLLRARRLRWLELSANPLRRVPLLRKLSEQIPTFFCNQGDLSHEGPPPRTRRSVTSLLGKLHDQNAEGGTRQRMEAPGPVPKEIATLGRRARPTSPQLAERFRFAGRWVGAWLGQTWLAPGDVQRLSPPLRRQVALRRQNWSDSIVAQLHEDRLSLFGVDRQDGGETYLVWTDSKPEPEIVCFTGWSEKRYRDLRTFLAAVVRD